MKLKEFNDVLKKSVKFNISNQSEQIDFEEFIVTNNYKKPIYFKKFAISALSVVLLFAVSFYMYLRLTPVTTLTIDFNPSFEVQLNTFNRAVKVDNQNADASSFTEGLDLLNKPIDQIMNIIYEKGIDEGYFTSDHAFLLIGVIGTDDELEEEINELITQNTQLTTLTLFEHVDNGTSIFPSYNIQSGTESYYSTIPTATPSSSDVPLDGANDIIDATTGNIERELEVNDITLYLNDFNLSRTQLAVIVSIYLYYEYSTYDELDYLASLNVENLIIMFQNIQ